MKLLYNFLLVTSLFLEPLVKVFWGAEYIRQQKVQQSLQIKVQYQEHE